MNLIRVLVVEESSLIRRKLTAILGSNPELNVVAAVATGRLALANLHDLVPDVVLLDVSPPEREGLKTLASLRNSSPDIPIIVFSQLTDRGSQTTVDAMLLGATDYVTKPEVASEFDRCVRIDLTAKIKSLATPRQAAPPGSVATAQANQQTSSPRLNVNMPEKFAIPTRSASSTRTAEIVAIATSTGGPNALASLLSSLPSSFATPIVIVQHMPAGFTTTLAESLRRQTGRNIQEANAIQPLSAAPVWLAPGGRHLVIRQDGMTLYVEPNDGPPENGCTPSADVLFRSVAEHFGSRCLAVILTGMGCDGLAGSRIVRQSGGQVLAQDEASSVAWGMPGQVVTAGLADEVFPLADLAHEIHRRTNQLRLNRTGMQ